MPTRTSPKVPCPYCGKPSGEGAAKAVCSLCGMDIRAGHFPHIVVVPPDRPPVHFCSVPCMDNAPFLEADDDEG